MWRQMGFVSLWIYAILPSGDDVVVVVVVVVAAVDQLRAAAAVVVVVAAVDQLRAPPPLLLDSFLRVSGAVVFAAITASYSILMTRRSQSSQVQHAMKNRLLLPLY